MIDFNCVAEPWVCVLWATPPANTPVEVVCPPAERTFLARFSPKQKAWFAYKGVAKDEKGGELAFVTHWRPVTPHAISFEGLTDEIIITASQKSITKDPAKPTVSSGRGE